jgi:hypothetical protein
MLTEFPILTAGTSYGKTGRLKLYQMNNHCVFPLSVIINFSQLCFLNKKDFPLQGWNK